MHDTDLFAVPAAPQPVQMPADAAELPGAKARSAVSNGSRLFVEALDGRTVLARRYRDLVHEFTSDMGTDIPEATKQLIRRAASLSVWCEQEEARLAKGEPVDIGPLTTATNALRRIVQDLNATHEKGRRARRSRRAGGMPVPSDHLSGKMQPKIVQRNPLSRYGARDDSNYNEES